MRSVQGNANYTDDNYCLETGYAPEGVSFASGVGGRMQNESFLFFSFCPESITCW